VVSRWNCVWCCPGIGSRAGALLHGVFARCLFSTFRLLLVRIIAVAVAVKKPIYLALFPFQFAPGHWRPYSDGLTHSPPPSSASASASTSTR